MIRELFQEYEAGKISRDHLLTLIEARIGEDANETSKATENDPSPAPSPARLLIQIQPTGYADKNIRIGRMLRFNLTWIYEHPEFGDLGMTVEGCLMKKRARGKVVWFPPISTFGQGRAKQLHAVTPALYRFILAQLIERGYDKQIGLQGPELLTSMKQIEDVSPELAGSMEASL